MPILRMFMNWKIITLCILGLALIGGGILGFPFLKKRFPQFFPKPSVHATDVTKIVDLTERTVNLADTTDAHYLKITIAIEITGQGVAEEVLKENQPKLFNGLITAATKYSYYMLLTQQGKEQLRRELVTEFNIAIHETGWKVKDVLFTDFVME